MSRLRGSNPKYFHRKLTGQIKWTSCHFIFYICHCVSQSMSNRDNVQEIRLNDYWTLLRFPHRLGLVTQEWDNSPLPDNNCDDLVMRKYEAGLSSVSRRPPLASFLMKSQPDHKYSWESINQILISHIKEVVS